MRDLTRDVAAYADGAAVNETARAAAPGDVKDAEHAGARASQRAHGVHGEGDAREHRRDDERTLPGDSDDSTPTSDRTGDYSVAGWGSEAAGGSVADKRNPGKRERKRDV